MESDLDDYYDDSNSMSDLLGYDGTAELELSDAFSIASELTSGSTEIILSDDVMSVSSESDISTVDMSDIENSERTDSDQNSNEPSHDYPLRNRSRNGGNVAPIPPSRISNVNSDTEMESVNDGEDSSGEGETEQNQINDGENPEDGNNLSQSTNYSQSGAEDENSRGPAVEESLWTDNPHAADHRVPLSEIISSQQVQIQQETPHDNVKKHDTPPKAKKNKTSSDTDEGDDGMTCSVCLDFFTNSGPHRLVSLRCGHLFGNSCVERWLKSGCMGGVRRCPTCNKKANLRDVRVIYARKLQAIDTSEKDRVQTELDKVKEEKSRLEIDLTKIKLNFDMQKKVIEQLKQRILYLESFDSISKNERNNLPQNSLNSKSITTGRISLVGNIDLRKSGNCRVLGFSPNIGLLVASQKSSVSLFPGFGIRKIDSVDLRPTTFVNLHSSAIRDLAFHSDDVNLLLSVSLDKSAKIFDNVSNCIVQTFKSDNLLWSCAWDKSNPHQFMTGSQNGIVKIYDKRQTNEPVSACTTDGDTTPVVSLSSIPPTRNSVLTQGGFLSCRLNAVYAYGNTNSACQLVMTDGPFISLNYNPSTQLILASTRPSSRFQNTRHMLHQLAATGGENFCNNIHVFTRGNSGQLMSRSCQLLMPDDDVVVVAHNESKNAMELLSVNKNDAIHTIPVSEPIIDLCPLKINDSCFLGSLSGNNLLVHKIY